jgi:hypothetical protein
VHVDRCPCLPPVNRPADLAADVLSPFDRHRKTRFYGWAWPADRATCRHRRPVFASVRVPRPGGCALTGTAPLQWLLTAPAQGPGAAPPPTHQGRTDCTTVRRCSGEAFPAGPEQGDQTAHRLNLPSSTPAGLRTPFVGSNPLAWSAFAGLPRFKTQWNWAMRRGMLGCSIRARSAWLLPQVARLRLQSCSG